MYAYLAEAADAEDRVAAPVFLAAGVKPAEVESMSARAALDDWLDGPIGRQAEAENALLRHLGIAG